MQTKRRRPGVENAKSKLLRNMSRMLMEDATSRACWTPGAVKKRRRCKPSENCWRQWALFCAFSGSCFGDRFLGALE